MTKKENRLDSMKFKLDLTTEDIDFKDRRVYKDYRERRRRRDEAERKKRGTIYYIGGAIV